MMNNDPISIEFIKWMWSLLSIPLWFLFKKSSEISTALSNHKLYAANNYVKHSELKDMETRILAAIGDLKEDIKNKADK